VRKSLVIFALCLGVFAAPARADEPKESQIKAAFLYNFAQFITWPERAFSAPDAPFVVAVIGTDPLNGDLDAAMAGKTVMGRPVVVVRFASIDQLQGCHLLFVPRSEDPRLSAIFEKIASMPVLTVGESEAFPWANGGIRFFSDDNHIRFEVNLRATKDAGLEISSRLLKLARIFKRK
jgi:hypothetical protein